MRLTHCEPTESLLNSARTKLLVARGGVALSWESPSPRNDTGLSTGKALGISTWLTFLRLPPRGCLSVGDGSTDIFTLSSEPVIALPHKAVCRPSICSVSPETPRSVDELSSNDDPMELLRYGGGGIEAKAELSLLLELSGAEQGAAYI